MFNEMYVLGIGLSFLIGNIATIIRVLLDRREMNKRLKEGPSEQEIRDRILKLISENNKDERVNEK